MLNIILLSAAVCCSVLQCVAVCCSVLQCNIVTVLPDKGKSQTKHAREKDHERVRKTQRLRVCVC